MERSIWFQVTDMHVLSCVRVDGIEGWCSYPTPLGGTICTVEAGSQGEEPNEEVEGEDLGHHRPLPAGPGHSKHPPASTAPGPGSASLEEWQRVRYRGDHMSNPRYG